LNKQKTRRDDATSTLNEKKKKSKSEKRFLKVWVQGVQKKKESILKQRDGFRLGPPRMVILVQALKEKRKRFLTEGRVDGS